MKGPSFAFIDGWRSFWLAINAFAQAAAQICILHNLRRPMCFYVWKDREAAAADMRAIFEAGNGKSPSVAPCEGGLPREIYRL